MAKKRKILITSALPYANGPIHIGHMLEYIQTDIWTRFQRNQGHEVYFAWADDAHGTPIMLRAQKEGITAEQLIQRMNQEHQQDFRDFHLSYDNFTSTHSEHNRVLVHDIYHRLLQNGHIETREIEQLYDPEANMFLPDRMIRGTCPNCKTPDQYGDACEACGKTYQPTDLIEPYSGVSGSQPVLKSSEHYFVKLTHFSETIQQWMQGGALQPEVQNKMAEWFADGLRDWDISRDAPYFGFQIPHSDNKYFYVWVDAPIGYMASFKELAERLGLDFDAWWKTDSEAEIYHFIGKDIIYFHTLFWPAMLLGAGLRVPTAVFAHGFLTVDGVKMSKSRGTFINARTYLDHLNPDYLRYYFAAKLSTGLADIDLNLDDFVQRVNADLVGKVVNIASRCAGFIQRQFNGQLAKQPDDAALYQEFVAARDGIRDDFEQRNFQSAVRQIMALADRANQYIDLHKPWQLIKQEGQADKVQAVCTQGINLFRILITYLSPIIPATADKAAEFLALESLAWDELEQPLLGRTVNPFKPLMMRVDPAKVSAMVEASKQSLQPSQTQPTTKTVAEKSAEITFDEFSRIDLRVARIIHAETIPEADKLLRLTLDIGNANQCQVLAGIKSAYTPEQLEGRLTVMVANLKPRKMRFGISEGMVLAAGPGGEDLFLLNPDSGAEPGMRVK